ncbi:MAG: polysaccharide deacetylase family protein, partial [bacterium]|nr:polysaccharide deacetylase family protein [bacterium]
MTRPIFFDPTGRRGIWARRSVALLLIAIVIAAIAFATTLIAVPSEGDLALPLPQPHAARLSGMSNLGRDVARWLPRLRGGHSPAKPLTVGFYVPDMETSIASLRRHVGQLDWVVPALITVSGGDPAPRLTSDSRFDRMIAAMPRPPKVLPMVQNLDANGDWDGANTARLLADPAASGHLAQRLGVIVTTHHQAGLVLDFEEMPAGSMAHYLRFLHMVRAALPAHSKLAVTVPAGDDGWPFARFAQVADRVILMAYDQHWQSGQPGPIAAQNWFVQEVEKARRTIGTDRIIVALGSYAYDWHGGGADALSLGDAWLAAHDSGAQIGFDRSSGNTGFAYDEDGVRHRIWMLDAAATWNQLRALKQLGIDSVALWRLGSEDPGVWPDLTAFRKGRRPDLASISSMLTTDVNGTGEILRITATPTEGSRIITFGKQDTIEHEYYRSLPTPYQVQRIGASPKMLALTFDDGPDAEWTPKILSILEQMHAPATFFVIGENALEHPGILERIVADGDEIGNHTYGHPNLATWSDESTRLELNATQRLVQAYTGHSMRLFRAPYFGDAEPTTADELGPALAAQKAGYTVVGLHVDPNDWQRPGVDAIVQQVVDQVHEVEPNRSENIILLHDGGGDRSQTIAALPRIIATLRAQGYQFVPVSRLAGLSHQAAMPPVAASDLLAVRVDVAVFVVLALTTGLLGWI